MHAWPLISLLGIYNNTSFTLQPQDKHPESSQSYLKRTLATTSLTLNSGSAHKGAPRLEPTESYSMYNSNSVPIFSVHVRSSSSGGSWELVEAGA